MCATEYEGHRSTLGVISQESYTLCFSRPSLLETKVFRLVGQEAQEPPISTSCGYKIKSPHPVYYVMLGIKLRSSLCQLGQLPSPIGNPLVHVKTVFPLFLPDPYTKGL